MLNDFITLAARNTNQAVVASPVEAILFGGNYSTLLLQIAETINKDSHHVLLSYPVLSFQDSDNV